MRSCKHGHAARNKATRTYVIWLGMTRRCRDKNVRDYPRYGGRGIKVCDRWLEYANFLEDMGEIKAPFSIDRINNDGDYEPSNCRLSTPAEQSRNSTLAKKLTFNGETLCVRDWEKKLGLSVGALWHRFKRGWTDEEIFTTRKMK